MLQPLSLKPINLTFQEDGHIHLLNGKPVPGCTSISGLFQDDGWKFAWPPKEMYLAAMDSLSNINAGRPSHDGRFSIAEVDDVLSAAKGAWKRKRDKSADTGTAGHKWIQRHIDGFEDPLPQDPEMLNIVQGFLAWKKEAKPIWLACELQVGSEEHNYAGILDGLVSINGTNTLIDFKTSKAIKPEYNIQLAGLCICLEEMGFRVDVRAILHLPKEGKYEYRVINSYLKRDKEAFLAGLEFYRHKNMFMGRNK